MLSLWDNQSAHHTLSEMASSAESLKELLKQQRAIQKHAPLWRHLFVTCFTGTDMGGPLLDKNIVCNVGFAQGLSILLRLLLVWVKVTFLFPQVVELT